MHAKTVKRRSAGRLFEIRNRFGEKFAKEKLALLDALDGVETQSPAAIRRLHAALCFIRAFPDTAAHCQRAQRQLDAIRARVASLPARLRPGLWDSGIIGTPVHYAFSFEVASWMSRRAPGSVRIDWGEIDDTSALDDLLAQLLLPSEDDYFNSGFVDTREWMELAVSGESKTDLDWLFAQLREERFKPVWSQMYNAADLPLVWDLRHAGFSKTENMLPARHVQPRCDGMRKRVHTVKKEIMRPLDSFRRVSPHYGSQLIDTAMASLAVRHRETTHFNCANSREVYLADIGRGVSIAVFGMREKDRYPLETTMGYLIVSHGVPIGYGGASALFRQVNTGINIFDEFRGGEAAYLWVQVMRVYRNLFGCTRFIIDAYQLGDGNTEALQSGAFWFHHRLGYRPVSASIRRLARRESALMQRDDSYRCSRNILRRLASCDMHLKLPDACASDLFEERWLETSSLLATRELAAAGGPARGVAADRVVAKVARDLRMRSVRHWSADEKRGLRGLAPIVAATNPVSWSNDEKRLMRQLLRAKGGPFEVDYARIMNQHGRFLAELRVCCHRAHSSGS